ncbi:hypothetical protein [Nocardiopsis dassonvillei]|uniref:hypothetical protein n=1 Tax=Nocardiopsis dassonvillei TaxID=2014 RepID=UPI003637AB7D
MAITNGYCTAAQVRTQLGDADSQLVDVDLERAINAASRAVDRHCSRRFWSDATPVERTYTVHDPHAVWVDDISTTTGLIITTDDTRDGTWGTTWDADDYQLEPLNADADETAHAWWRIKAIGARTFPVTDHRAVLKVTASWGWSAVPDDVAEATILKAASLFKRREATFGVAGFGEFGAVRISRRDPDIIDMLAPFVRITLDGF